MIYQRNYDEIKSVALHIFFIKTRSRPTCLLVPIKGHVPAGAGHFLISRLTARSSEFALSQRKLSKFEIVIMLSLFLVINNINLLLIIK